MSSNRPYLHIYAQQQWHEHAFVVGNREALEYLRDAINSALAEGVGKATASTGDGEGFEVAVYAEDETNFWDMAQLPYVNEIAWDVRDDSVGPWDLFKKYKTK